MKSIIAHAPASIANVGPFFDVMGYCLNHLGDFVEARKAPHENGMSLRDVKGPYARELADHLANGSGVNCVNVIADAFWAEFKDQINFGVDLILHKYMPVKSGLGSSAASCVAATRAIVEMLPPSIEIDKTEKNNIMMRGEREVSRHYYPDNIVPSYWRGFHIIAQQWQERVGVPNFFTCVFLNGQIEKGRSDEKPYFLRDTADTGKKRDELNRFFEALVNDSGPIGRKIERMLNYLRFQSRNAARVMHALHTKNIKLFGETISAHEDNFLFDARDSFTRRKDIWEIARKAGGLGCAIAGSGPSSFLQLNSIARHDAWGGMRVLTLEPIDMSQIGAPRVKYTLERARDRLSAEEQELLSEIASQALIHPDYYKPVIFNFEIVWSWIQKMTNYNYRYALDLLSRSLSSFHLFDINFEREKYMPVNRFDISRGIHVKKMKTALINGLELFYSPASGTPVVNLFDAGDTKLKGNHIIRIKMLQYLLDKQAFVLSEAVERCCNVFGSQYLSAIQKAIYEMVVKGLIVIVNQSGVPMVFAEDYGGIVKYEDIARMSGRVGACGRFHLEELLDDDIYLDEMKYATDFDRDLYKKIFENKPERFPWIRKSSTRRFIKEILQIEEAFGSWAGTLRIDNQRLAKTLYAYENQKSREEFFVRRANVTSD